MSQIWVMADKIWMMQMRRCHTAVEEQKAHYSVELIDVAYPGRIRELFVDLFLQYMLEYWCTPAGE